MSEKSKNNKEVDDNTVEVVALSPNNKSKEDVPENSENIKKDVVITVEVVALSQNSKGPENSKNTKGVDEITTEVVPIPEKRKVDKEISKITVKVKALSPNPNSKVVSQIMVMMMKKLIKLLEKYESTEEDRNITDDLVTEMPKENVKILETIFPC